MDTDYAGYFDVSADLFVTISYQKQGSLQYSSGIQVGTRVYFTPGRRLVELDFLVRIQLRP